MKARIALILLVAAASLVGYFIASSFLFPKLVLEKEEALLTGGRYIAVKTEVEGDAFFLGDIISYKIKVLYNQEKVEIDKTSLGKSVVFDPFEIISLKEKDFEVNSNTRMYLREYEIQLLDGWPNQLYTFPAINVRHNLLDTYWIDKKVTPQPIFISPRMPQNVTGLQLKPIKGRVINVGYERIPLMLWGLGGGFIALGIVKILRRLRARRKEKKDYQRRLEGLKDLFEAYQKLSQGVSEKKDLKTLLHQAHQILRVMLSRKEGIDWPKPELDKLPSRIKRVVLNFLAKSEKAYSQEALEQKDVRRMLGELKKVFNFYIKE